MLGLDPVAEPLAFTDVSAIPVDARPEVAATVKAGIIKGLPMLGRLLDNLNR